MSHWVLNIKKIGKLMTVGVIAAMLGLSLIAATPSFANWQMSGQSILNWRFQPLEFTISASNAANLKVKFALPNSGGGDVSATPSVFEGNLYYPDWAGNLFSVNATTGAVIWTDNLSALTGVIGAVSRTTPTVNGNTLIVATQTQYLLAVDRLNGQLLWKTQLDSHPLAVLTQSPVVFNGVIYTGVSSLEEGAAADPAYPCCTFRGSFMAIKASTGAILWKTYTVPANGGLPGGYSGNAVWGSNASVDPIRKLVYISTGNNYTVPATVTNGGQIDPGDYTDAILALNMASGQVVWADKLMGLTSDTWTVACFTSLPGTGNCPAAAGPDYDFGQGPIHTAAVINGRLKDLIVDGQKSGNVWAVNPDTGAVVWQQNTGSGSSLGGMEWGSATDGQRIYVANAAGGFWAALNPATGAIIWKTNDPNPVSPGFGVKDIGAVSVANGVVYVGSLGGGSSGGATNPTMFALNAKTGQILWSFASGGSVASGPAIANGIVYWGNGYSHFGIGVGAGAKSFYAFSVK